MEMDLFSERTRRLAAWTLFGLALAYAFVAGLRTVADFDVGWLLALGRYLVTHHAVPRTDVLSYTAAGVPWIYPPFGGALLYLVYTVGGFSALSWINAIACAAVVAVTVGRPRLLTSALAVLAVPSIAFRTAPRAELFTTFFFAAYLALLCQYRRQKQSEDKTGSKARLWLLPLLMLAWVNVHSGFSSGVALLGAYVAWELQDCCFASRRLAAVTRLRSAAPWILFSFLATAMNPWGFGVYRALGAHNKLADFQSAVVSEWAGIRLTPAAFAGAFQLRDPNSGYWWLLLFAGVAAATALSRRQFAEALLLAGAAYLSVEHVRFQALFAIVVVVIGGDVFSRRLAPFHKSAVRAAAAATAIIAALALLHIADTISDRSYLANGELSTFGAGLSWWYPQAATEFIAGNALPAQLFHDYASGGYLTLRLGPQYPDFADGRGIPFPLEVLTTQSALVESSPDSALWTQQADHYGINTIILSLARIGGLEHVPLNQYCESSAWKPVYLDDVSIVLVRNRPQNQGWIERFKIDCASYQITPSHAPPSNPRARAEAYNFYANTASIYYLLGRDHDAFEAAARAQALFTDDPGLPLLLGQLLQANGKFAEAEAQYRRSLRLHPTDTGWYLLAQIMLAQKNYPEAASALRHAADLALFPAGRYLLLGDVDLAMNRPKEALQAFDSAERFGQKLAALPNYAAFGAKLAEGRGRAHQLLAANPKSAPALPASGLSAPAPASPR